MIHWRPFKLPESHMGKPLHTLRRLRAIALEHASVARPDLASMARDLGQVVHRDAQATIASLAHLGQQARDLDRWLLGRRNQPAVSVMVMAWPANHRTPVHDHAGLWGLELALVGALEVQSWIRNPDTGELRALRHDWLGPGDGTWFEGDPNHVHRCRNLSQHETALTLHVYGGELARYFAYEQTGPTQAWMARPQQAAMAGRVAV